MLKSDLSGNGKCLNTLWLLLKYHLWFEWEMPSIHDGYCYYTINVVNGKYLNYMMVIVIIPLILWMGNTWNTWWFICYNHCCYKWEIPELHYGFCTFTMSYQDLILARLCFNSQTRGIHCLQILTQHLFASQYQGFHNWPN